ncbi:hypothetical protein B0H12DRAFT_46047 [Mycena haematopus]|nr:hypothetical protein B0H12DRAFT_46047 [Mycena haematopus]
MIRIGAPRRRAARIGLGRRSSGALIRSRRRSRNRRRRRGRKLEALVIAKGKFRMPASDPGKHTTVAEVAADLLRLEGEQIDILPSTTQAGDANIMSDADPRDAARLPARGVCGPRHGVVLVGQGDCGV